VSARLPRALALGDGACLALLLGVATSALHYRYGFDNQAAELPLALRAMDPSYLNLDFYTQVSDAAGPKRPLALLLAAFATPHTLPLVCFLGVCAVNTAIGILSFATARRLAPSASWAPPLAAALALSISTFRLGYAGEFASSELVASHAAEPLVLFALCAAAAGRAIAAQLAAAAATALHFSFGLEAGALALALCAPLRANPLGSAAKPRAWLAGALLLAASALALAPVAWPAGAALASDFVAIESQLRHPHHNYWRAMPVADRLRALAFAGAALLAGWGWLRERARSDTATRALLALAAGLALGAAAHLALSAFALPALVAAARPLRLLWIAKWIGLLAIAVALAAPAGSGGALARAAVALAFAASVRPSRATLALLALGAAATLALRALPTRAARAASAAAAALLALHAGFGAALPSPLAGLGARLRPPLTLDALRGPEAEIARAARAVLPRDAIVLTPPGFARFRLIAERAVVVDFKAFPFQADAMRAWRERLFGCYGETQRTGFAALAELSRNYRERGLAAGTRCDFGATHAVLAAELPAPGPVLARTADYQLVQLAPPGSAPGIQGERESRSSM
jgi:hypothetical protein